MLELPQGAKVTLIVLDGQSRIEKVERIFLPKKKKRTFSLYRIIRNHYCT